MIELAFALMWAAQEAPQETQEAPQETPEVVVTASPLAPPERFDAPHHTSVVTVDDIRARRLSRTIPESLKESVGIQVQKTGHGQGSPFIRGVTGYRNLLLVDGIRMNNSTWRSGPNQYWALVDRYLVDRMEVMRGPAPVLYGSDSMGGTVVVYTREPEEFGDGVGVRPAFLGRASDAENSFLTREEVRGHVGSLGFIGGLTIEEFGDVEGGKHTGTQPNTSYRGWDGDWKFVWRSDEATKWVAAWQRTDLYDSPRTHSTSAAREWHGTSVGTDRRRDIDNRRELVYVQVHRDAPLLWFDRAQASLSWQQWQERLTRIRATGAQEIRTFDVDTVGLWARASNDTRIGTLTYGFDWYRDFLDSAGRNVSAAGVTTRFERGDVADNTIYDLAGLFLQDQITIGRFDITAGVRLQYAAIDADEVDPSPAAGPAFPSIDEEWTRVVGSVRVVWHLSERWNLIAGVGQGFRAPSANDLTSTSLVLSGATEIPSPDLEPEETITYEVGVRTEQETWAAEAFAFWTDWRSVMERVTVPNPFPGEPATVERRTMFHDGQIYGFEIAASWRPCASLTLFGDFAYVFGETMRFSTSGRSLEPMDKVNQPTAHLGVRLEPPDLGLWVEGIVTITGEQDRLSPSDKTDTQRIPPGGTPGFTIFTIRGGWEISEHALLTAAIENVGDKDYRFHGSGSNEPGINAIVGLQLRW